MPIEILSADEVRALIRASSNRAPTGIRDRALIVVMYRGGLRLAEALALLPKDVDTRTGTVRVLRGKAESPAPWASTRARWRSSSAGSTSVPGSA
jgi:integrase/recombinase XerD